MSENEAKPTASQSAETAQDNGDSVFERWIKRIILGGFAVFFIVYFIYVVQDIIRGEWISALMQHQPAATVMLAFAALVAFFVVLLLQYSAGQIRFKVPGFEFEGASGPVVLWVLCFLAVTTAIKWLWVP